MKLVKKSGMWIMYILMLAVFFANVSTTVASKENDSKPTPEPSVAPTVEPTTEPTETPSSEPTSEPEEASPTPTPAPVNNSLAAVAPSIYVKKKTVVKWKVKKIKCNYPKKLWVSRGFTVKGKIKFDRKIKSVTGRVVSSKNKVVLKKVIKVKNKKTVSLKKLDALKFSKLKKGRYTYEVVAVDRKKTRCTVIRRVFVVKQPKWTAPIRGARYGDGWHCHCGTHGGRHYGWDILGGGLNIRSIADGVVVYAKYHHSSGGSFGKLTVVYHGNGIYSYYAHASKIKVKAGKRVSQGDVLGVTGSTGFAFGAHLHFETRKGPAFSGGYNAHKFLDKYTYKQFNPSKLIKR